MANMQASGGEELGSASSLHLLVHRPARLPLLAAFSSPLGCVAAHAGAGAVAGKGAWKCCDRARVRAGQGEPLANQH